MEKAAFLPQMVGSVVLKRKTCNKKESATNKLEDIRKFHNLVRFVISLAGNRERDSKWGRFPPHTRYNVDQVPMPFVTNLKNTMAESGEDVVWVRQNHSGLEKRFCTLQICFRPEGRQPKPTVIFRGQGKQISAVERNAWDNRVNVMFQPKAWADRDFSNKWASEHFGKWLQEEHGEEETLLFCDGLDSQKTPEFLDRLRTNNCFRLISPPECTPYVQAVDGGLVANTKFLMSKQLEKWMEVDDNLDQWENGSISASDKRILITRFLGCAWEELFSSPHYHPRSYFERTGCLLTVDGSGDELVKIKGVNINYTVPPMPTHRVMDDDDDLQQPTAELQSPQVPTEEPEILDEDFDDVDDEFLFVDPSDETGIVLDEEEIVYIPL